MRKGFAIDSVCPINATYVINLSQFLDIVYVAPPKDEEDDPGDATPSDCSISSSDDEGGDDTKSKGDEKALFACQENYFHNYCI